MSSLWTNAFPPKPKWSTEEIPDLAGKVMMVTGGTGGIGKETARVLLSKNARVIIAARSQAKGDAAVKDLKAVTGKDDVTFLKVDLANLKSIKEAAEEFLSHEEKLDVLINNGGVMFPPINDITSDGYDLQFGTNVIGHFYLTKLLLPALRTAAKSSPDGKARIINVSSVGHKGSPKEGLDFSTFKDGRQRKKRSTYTLYLQSKFGNIVLSNELARRYADDGIVSISLHPGTIKTDLSRHTNRLLRFFFSWFFYPIQMGVLTQLYAATMPEALNLNGKYMMPFARVGLPRKDTNDAELGKKLWSWLEEQVKDV